MEKVYIVIGMVEETLPMLDHQPIALLRLDTDLYSSTKIELEILYSKVKRGGIIIVDDYGHWSGAKKAVDEFSISNWIKLKWNWIDGTGIIMEKP